MSGKKSRDKGKRGEREVAKMLRGHGLRAHRGVQYQGGPDSPDVICESMPGMIIEVKRSERLNIYAAMKQCLRDAGDKIATVFHRKSNEEWLVIMTYRDWILFADAYYGNPTADNQMSEFEITDDE